LGRRGRQKEEIAGNEEKGQGAGARVREGEAG
jgi:hypothetical protein